MPNLIKSLFSSKPRITPIDTKQTVNSSGTQTGTQNQTQRGNLTTGVTGTQTGTSTRLGSGTQVSGLQDQSLLGPLRDLLSQTQGSPSAEQRNALGTLSSALADVGGASSPAGYAADRQQVLQDASNAGRLVNANLANSGLSSNASAGGTLRNQLQNQTQQNLLSAYDRNRNAQLQNIGALAQTVQGVGEQQRLAPVTTAGAYGSALSPFSRVGTTQQSATDQTQQQSDQQTVQNTLQELVNSFSNTQTGNQTTTGTQPHVGASNLQNLLGLLGGVGGLISGIRGN